MWQIDSFKAGGTVIFFTNKMDDDYIIKYKVNMSFWCKQ